MNMAPARVIQDSDDEDDALSDVATSIDPLQEQEPEQGQHQEEEYANPQTEHGEEPYEKEMRTAEPVVTGSQLGVNFDDFLQSQPQTAGEHGPSSSQLRREERWIPAESANESVGAMMSEIGHAQRLLVDDVAALDYPQLPSTDQSADPLLCTYQSPSAGASGLKRPQPMVDAVDQEMGTCSEQQTKRSRVSEDENGEDEIVDLPQNGNEHGLQELLQHSAAMDEQSQSVPNADDPVDKASTNDNEASVTNSYNYFDSSLKLREYTEVSTIPIASPGEERDELVETIRRTPGRSKSMQVSVDSPHDTEPFSSLISPHVKRAKSDMPVRRVSPKPSMDTPDELSLPVTVEMPVAQKKKRGRKKKQPVEDDIDGEPDELNADATHDIHEEPKKRGRGRPRKIQVEDVRSPKTHLDELHALQDVNADAPQPSGQAYWRAIQNGRTDAIALNPVEADAGLLLEQYVPRPSRSRAQPIENYESPDSISELSKETKKRKIKRGKTTSIIMKKSYESDVEDDVIWIDEKPTNGPSKAKEATPAAHNSETPVDDFVEGVDHDTKDIKPVNMTEDPTKQELINQAETGELPAPKKRGRKRKKTMEPVIADPPVEEQIPEDMKPNEQHTALEDITNNAVPLTTTEKEQSTTNDNNIQETRNLTPEPPISTPKKQAAEPQKENTTAACTPQNTSKGPDKHSPITSTSKIPYRVGLSRRARIAPLLKVVRK